MIPKKTHNYLNFDKSRMVNLEYSLNREILRTNRKGAYHCTSLAECNTRKQHGLLVLPVPKLGNTNHVLLSSLDETIIQHGAEFNLGIHKYDGENYSPMGHKYIREFSCDVLPRIIYRVGGVIISKEKMFSLENNTIFIRYTLLDAHSPTTIRFRPFLAFREVNELTQENSVANHGYKEVENGISMCMYTGYPNLYMQFSKSDMKFDFKPQWNKGVEYIKDMEDGIPFKEDLYVPGYFEMPIKKGESIVFVASDTPAKLDKLHEVFDRGIEKRTPRSSFYNCLRNSAHQFYYNTPSGGAFILNGYPWGRVKVREQFMALEGLTVSIGNLDVFENVLDTAIPIIRAFMRGEEIKSPMEGIDEPDVLLWLLRNLKRFFDIDGNKFHEKYSAIVREIVQFILANRHPRLKLEKNMLLSIEGCLKPGTWMDGVMYGRPIVPRSGFVVEINVLWYESLMFCQELAAGYGKKEDAVALDKYAAKVKESFNAVFVNDGGYLYDYVDGLNSNRDVRPSMLYAVSSPYPLLEKRQAKSVLDVVTKELLMSKGLRTLSPKSGGFKPRYEGCREEKDHSVFNGVARAWLIAPYLEAYIKVFQRSGLSFMDRFLIGIEGEMANDCIGTLSQMYDGNMPSLGHGATSSAIDVAGVLRALAVRESFSEKYK